MKLRFWENRESGGQSPGNYSDAIVRLLESVAANKTIDASEHGGGGGRCWGAVTCVYGC